MHWLLILIGSTVIGGLSQNDVIVINHTGLFISRIQIDERTFHELENTDKILIEVTPTRHHMTVVFKGGADVIWKHFEFRGVHELIFERVLGTDNKFEVKVN